MSPHPLPSLLNQPYVVSVDVKLNENKTQHDRSVTIPITAKATLVCAKCRNVNFSEGYNNNNNKTKNCHAAVHFTGNKNVGLVRSASVAGVLH